MSRLTSPQRALLDEIAEAGILYVGRYMRYARTVNALVAKGYAVIVEPDYSQFAHDGYAVTPKAVEEFAEETWPAAKNGRRSGDG